MPTRLRARTTSARIDYEGRMRFSADAARAIDLHFPDACVARIAYDAPSKTIRVTPMTTWDATDGDSLHWRTITRTERRVRLHIRTFCNHYRIPRGKAPMRVEVTPDGVVIKTRDRCTAERAAA